MVLSIEAVWALDRRRREQYLARILGEHDEVFILADRSDGLPRVLWRGFTGWTDAQKNAWEESWRCVFLDLDEAYKRAHRDRIILVGRHGRIITRLEPL